MQIAFRVDASATIGTGHVMRCLTLADTLMQQGASCRFISRHLPNYLQVLIESKGHQSIRVSDGSTAETSDELPHAHFLGTSQAQDAEQTRAALKNLKPAWLVIDHYAIDYRWESSLRPFTDKLMVIDDLADRDHDCDLLVDQNLYPDMDRRYREKIPKMAEALLGAKYAILRQEFSEARKRAQVRTGQARRILIFFGGMDTANYTLPVLRAIKSSQLKALKVDVVIGAEHPTRESISNICQDQGYRCHIQTKKMAELLLQADLAIGAGGSTSWERCCLGLPSLAYIVAPNQEALTGHADSLGILKVGRADIHDFKALRGELRTFIEADAERECISSACLNRIDARGTHRIVARMSPTALQLRAATLDDAKRLFHWRNHPVIREVSTQSDPIVWETHEQWFQNVMQDANRLVYIAEHGKHAIGVIRFDIMRNSAAVSLYLAPDQFGRGHGTRLLLMGEQKLLSERPELGQIQATVMEGNQASHKLFKRCGYVKVHSKYSKIIHA